MKRSFWNSRDCRIDKCHQLLTSAPVDEHGEWYCEQQLNDEERK